MSSNAKEKSSALVNFLPDIEQGNPFHEIDCSGANVVGRIDEQIVDPGFNGDLKACMIPTYPDARTMERIQCRRRLVLRSLETQRRFD